MLKLCRQQYNGEGAKKLHLRMKEELGISRNDIQIIINKMKDDERQKDVVEIEGDDVEPLRQRAKKVRLLLEYCKSTKFGVQFNFSNFTKLKCTNPLELYTSFRDKLNFENWTENNKSWVCKSQLLFEDMVVLVR